MNFENFKLGGQNLRNIVNMDILKPDLMWIDGRCYRVYQTDSIKRNDEYECTEEPIEGKLFKANVLKLTNCERMEKTGPHCALLISGYES